MSEYNRQIQAIKRLAKRMEENADAPLQALDALLHARTSMEQKITLTDDERALFDEVAMDLAFVAATLKKGAKILTKRGVRKGELQDAEQMLDRACMAWQDAEERVQAIIEIEPTYRFSTRKSGKMIEDLAEQQRAEGYSPVNQALLDRLFGDHEELDTPDMEKIRQQVVKQGLTEEEIMKYTRKRLKAAETIFSDQYLAVNTALDNGRDTVRELIDRGSYRS